LLIGEGSLSDIGSLQAANSNNTLFQVASQFNCLESPGRYVTRVSNYFNDRTQGPRAAISAFPAALLRHYSAPGKHGERFVQQTDGPQINLLEDACGSGILQNGYFTGQSHLDGRSLITKLETNFEAIRVGVHNEAQVVLGYDWDGGVDETEPCRIAQVFTSTVAGGFYGGQDHLGKANFIIACRQLLRAAYLGTLLAALSLQRSRVVLTLIGGGVFSNPLAQIWEAIIWAAQEVAPLLTEDLHVIVNGRDMGGRFDLEGVALPVIRQFEGAILYLDDSGLVRVGR
jgi:predicted Rdx family selenoprotein